MQLARPSIVNLYGWSNPNVSYLACRNLIDQYCRWTLGIFSVPFFSGFLQLSSVPSINFFEITDR